MDSSGLHDDHDTGLDQMDFPFARAVDLPGVVLNTVGENFLQWAVATCLFFAIFVGRQEIFKTVNAVESRTKFGVGLFLRCDQKYFIFYDVGQIFQTGLSYHVIDHRPQLHIAEADCDLRFGANGQLVKYSVVEKNLNIKLVFQDVDDFAEQDFIIIHRCSKPLV